MSYKKIITITLVTVLLCTSLSAVVGAKDVEVKGINAIKAFQNSISDLIERIFSQIPILSVLFDRFVKKEKPETHTPQDPEPDPLLFEISMESTEYLIGEDIKVKATLTNIGNKPLYVADLDVYQGSLDFIIKTPEGYEIHIIEPTFQTVQKAVLLEPDQSLEYSIIINSEEDDIVFGVDFPQESADKVPIPYKFGIGTYGIQGKYTSDPEVPSDPSQLVPEIKVWKGEITTEPPLVFEIIDKV